MIETEREAAGYKYRSGIGKLDNQNEAGRREIREVDE